MNWMSNDRQQLFEGAFQGIKYGLVGAVSNGVLYALYLLLAHLTFPVLAAMTLTFAAGVALSWLLNGAITFRARLTRRSGLRMILVYVGAYIVNLMCLWSAVHFFSLPHQWVQLAVMLLLAVALFLAQKFWVFRPKP